MIAEQVIRRPLILTEKGNLQRAKDNKYLFEVDRGANKIEIKAAVETLFRVSVERVNTSMVRGRARRMGRRQGKTKNWKKAVVTLKEGDSIDQFEGG